MQKFKKILVVLTAITIGMSSATIAPKSTSISKEKTEALSKAIELAKLDGKVTKAELRNLAIVAKGEKLTLKEKIALTVFGKKIGNKLMTAPATEGGKSQVTALILVALIGGLGIHRFYLGYTWQGIVQLLTGGGCGIWWIIDLVRIITGDLKPKNGDYEKTL